MTKSVLKIAQRIGINKLSSTGMNQTVPEKLQQEEKARTGSWNFHAKYAAATGTRQGLAPAARTIPSAASRYAVLAFLTQYAK